MITLFTARQDRIKTMRHTAQDKTKRWIAQAEKSLVWVRCKGPDSESFDVISKLTGVEREYFDEVLEEDERPKLSAAKFLEVVYSVPTIEEGDVLTSPFYVYAKGNLVVTIEKKRNAVCESLATAMQNNKRKFLFKGNVGGFIAYLLDNFNDDFLRYIDRISVRVDIFKERDVLSKEHIERIYDSSVTLSYFNQALIANLEVVNALRRSYYRQFTTENRKQFNETYYDMLQIRDTEKIQRESIANLFNMQSVIASSRLNTFMKRVTLLAILVTVPAMVSGIYGMNVTLPLAENPYAFYIILGITALISLSLIIGFRVAENR